MKADLGRVALVSALLVVLSGCTSSGAGGVPLDGGAGSGGVGTGGVGGVGTGGIGGVGTGGVGGVGTGGVGGGSCALSAGQIDGDYLFALSVVIGADRPIVLINTVTTTQNGGSMQMNWNLQPVRSEDRTTPTGLPLAVSMPIGINGDVDADPDPVNIEADANPLTGSPLTADITSLKGQFCDLESFYCGTADGDLSKPLQLSINGSTWAMEKIVGGVYPEPPKIDCAKNLALPLPLPP